MLNSLRKYHLIILTKWKIYNNTKKIKLTLYYVLNYQLSWSSFECMMSTFECISSAIELSAQKLNYQLSNWIISSAIELSAQQLNVLAQLLNYEVSFWMYEVNVWVYQLKFQCIASTFKCISLIFTWNNKTYQAEKYAFGLTF